MKTDNYKTEVIFRREKDNTIIAVFPYDIASLSKDSVTCYVHIGQHTGATWNYVLADTKPAKANEYTELFEELESIGYNLKVVKRRNYKRYLQALYEARNK